MARSFRSAARAWHSPPDGRAPPDPPAPLPGRMSPPGRPESGAPLHKSAHTRKGAGPWCSRFPVCEPSHELETGPVIVYRTDLHVHQPDLEPNGADDILGEVAIGLGRFLGPGDPDGAVVRERPRQGRKLLPQLCLSAYEAV